MAFVVHKPLFPLTFLYYTTVDNVFFCYLPNAVSCLNSSVILRLMESQ